MSINPNNPILYTSRTYNTIMNDINTDNELKTKPNWWKRLWAGIGDVISIWNNALANLLFLRTSFTRGAVKDLCELIDYDLSAQITSSGMALFYVKTSLGVGIYPFTVTKLNLAGKSESTSLVASKHFEARANEIFTLIQDTFTAVPATDVCTSATKDLGYTGQKIRVSTSVTLPAPLLANTDYYVIRTGATTFKLANTLEDAYLGTAIDLTSAGAGVQTWTLYSKAVTLYQQNTLPTAVVIGTSDGTTEWQEFDLPDKFIIDTQLTITINSIAWTLVDTFVNSILTDTHYKLIPKSNNQFSIRFGNGIYGKIPEAFDIYASYSYGGGTLSNVSVLNKINAYAGSDSNLTGISNATVFTGGTDEESIISAKRLAPMLLKTRDRFITVDDGEALVLAYGGISLCKVYKNYYGLLSAKVIGISNGGGTISGTTGVPPAAPTGVALALQTYLIDRTVLESIDVRVEESTITTLAVTSAAKMLSGYTYTGGVDKYFELAWLLLLTETGYEIYNKYLSNGITDTVTLINTIFTKTFAEADYDQIAKLVSNMKPRNFGDVIWDSDVYGFIDSYVDGIDYITIANVGGAPLPYTLGSTAISKAGVLTLTEIP